MGLRPGRCYRKHERPYTRQATHVPKKGYVKGVPKHKIAQFELGKKGDYEKKLFLVAMADVQIRHNAIESARIAAVQVLEKNTGKTGDFFLKIRIYPHHVIRENVLATGAGADRFQTGMRQSFGKPIGTAARVFIGQKIFEIQINSQHINVAKLALKKAEYKLPLKCRVDVV
ncbi:MAG: 50S ribosomal protein L16 [Candidatus Aenigmatarchaeota archaeon]